MFLGYPRWLFSTSWTKRAAWVPAISHILTRRKGRAWSKRWGNKRVFITCPKTRSPGSHHSVFLCTSHWWKHSLWPHLAARERVTWSLYYRYSRIHLKIRASNIWKKVTMDSGKTISSLYQMRSGKDKDNICPANSTSLWPKGLAGWGRPPGYNSAKALGDICRLLVPQSSATSNSTPPTPQPHSAKLCV